MEAISITVATPITTPRMVRNERSLLVRRFSSATDMPRAGSRRASPTSPQRGDRIEPRGTAGRVHPEDDAGARPEQERHPHRPGRDPGGEGAHGSNQQGEDPSAQNAHDSAETGEQDGLDEKLAADVPLARAE
jgi:hypothetical protein